MLHLSSGFLQFPCFTVVVHYRWLHIESDQFWPLLRKQVFIKKSVGSLSFRPQGPKIHSLYLSQRVMRNLEFPPEISENQLKLEGLL